ncbi:MAG: ABC transporter permease [[Eubacterium] siraeum]
MFTLLWRKMRNTKWMVLCLFIGFLLAAGMMSTIPIYMDASLQRMLIKDMEQYQIDNNKYPGLYSVTKTLQITADTNAQQATIDDVVSKSDSRINAIGIASENSKTTLIDDCLYIVNGERNGSELSTRLKLIGMTDSLDHMKLVRGELPSKTSVDGVYEGLASEDALKTLGINMGNTYKIVSLAAGVEPYYVKITGVYEQKTDNDSYWAETLDSYLNAIFVDYDMVRNDLMPAGRFNAVNIARRYSLDYHTLDMNRISAVTAELEKDDAFYKEAGYAHEFNVADIIGNYTERAEKLTRILWILQIPAMVMLAFYLFMVSQLNVDRERNEIAVFKSRGASSWQIFGMYAAESGILGIVTLVVAPFIGLVLCQFLGVSNGFLEFVNRTGIAAKITGISIIYALLAVVVFFLTTMIPIIPASKLTIVQYKQSRTKVVKMSLWEKCGVDIVLLAVSFGFLYFYTTNITNSIAEGTFEATGELDPLLFIFSTLMILGFGLLFIRIYPYLLRLVYYVLRPFWTPSQYMAITTVCRSQGGKERFLMLFLVMTFSFGLFSANTARAINNNISDRIYYENGADVVMTEYSLSTSEEGGSSTYVETDFSRYEALDGVEIATEFL